eukprot:539653-Prymnesium_polylepis.1
MAYDIRIKYATSMKQRGHYVEWPVARDQIARAHDINSRARRTRSHFDRYNYIVSFPTCDPKNR